MMSFNIATGWRSRLALMTTLLVVALSQPTLAAPGKTASDPKMHGNAFTARTFTFWNPCLNVDGQIELPVLGRLPIGENMSAMPTDRIYFDYRGFTNPLTTTIGDGGGATLANRDFSVSRYTFGFEKTFHDGAASIELRMPLFGTVDSFFSQGVAQQTGSVGNVTLIPKVMLFDSDTAALSAGLGISVPTGEDSRITLDDEVFTLRNQAVHLAPFVGYVATPNDRAIYQGFVALDIPTNGNGLSFRDTGVGGPPADLGSVRDQTLLYIDVSAAYWLYWNPGSRGITGLAPSVELHYITGLDSDTVVDGNSNVLYGVTPCTEFALQDPNIDLLNLTFGLHTNVGARTTVYVGTVLPLTGDRLFDSEVQATVNISY